MALIPLTLFLPKFVANSAYTQLFATSPAGLVTVTKIVLTNLDGSPLGVSVFVLPAAGTPGLVNTVIDNITIGANSDYQCPELSGLVLGAGAVMYARQNTVPSGDALVTAIGGGFSVGGTL